MSITISSPLVASVSSLDLGRAEVVRVIAERLWFPVALLREATRCTVSPGTRPEAATLSRFAVPDAPRAMFTMPDATMLLAEVLEVKAP